MACRVMNEHHTPYAAADIINTAKARNIILKRR